MALDIENLIVVDGTNKLYVLLSQKGKLLVCKDLANDVKETFHISRCMNVKDIIVYNADDSTVTLGKIFDALSVYFEGKELPTLAQLKSDKIIKTEFFGMLKEKFAVAREPFENILPQFDQNRFLPTHMVKILRWYLHLDEILNTIDL